MIKIYNPQGKVLLTNDFFAGLVGNAITSCYGVAGMSVAGAKDGMISMDQSIANLYNSGKITKDTALQFAANPEHMTRMITG